MPLAASSRRPGRLAATLVAVAVAGALGAGGSSAVAASGVIESPRAGAKLSSNTVRIVVRAGKEWHHLDARLNGARVGTHFARRKKGRRVLHASASHGLRPGRNVLRVKAHTRGRTRRATVRFRVVRRALVGAGRERREPAGRKLRLRGRIRGHGASRSRWTLVAAPARSRHARRARKQRATRGASPARVRSVNVRLRTRGSAKAPAVHFRPDVRGRYVLRIATRVGAKTVTHEVAVNATPRSPVVEVDTAVKTDGVVGIRLGGKVYPPPPMAATASDPPWAGEGYQALWQIVAVDRTTLAPLWNRTYGACGPRVCRMGSDNLPVAVDAKQELEALGTGAMVIAASQAIEGWGPPNALDFATGTLAEVGFPSRTAPKGFPLDVKVLDQVKAGGAVAAIGVPGMDPGDAQISIVPNGSQAMVGYLGSDANNHYSFMPAGRERFDTRAAATCGGGTCTIAQTVGDGKATGTLADGQGGYLVSVWDGHTLALRASEMFHTNPEGISNPGYAIAYFLEQQARAGSVVLISSLRTPGLGTRPLVDPYAVADQWRVLANSVAAIGATRDTFNRTAIDRSASYSLVGWSGAGEGKGHEIADVEGRLSGALAPDAQSLFRPRNVVAGGNAAERLTQLVLRDPVERWPLDDDPAQHAALDWIGSQVPMLGDSPRQAYWTQTIDRTTAEEIHNEIEDVEYDPSDSSFGGVSFTAADFGIAQKQLEREILWVGKVRDYLARLSAPQTQAGDNAWQKATVLQDDLEAQLANLKAEAELRFNWFAIASSVAAMVTPFLAGLTEEAAIAAKVIRTFAGATNLSGALFQGLWNGSTNGPQNRRVEADKLAEAIAAQAQTTAFGYTRMGDMIVSDPTKLAELGKWARCNPNGGCGPDGRYAEYSLTANAQTVNGTLATRAVERELYRQLVPLAFPVWDTGTTHWPPGAGDVPDNWDNPVLPKETFSCSPVANNPFLGSPAATRYAFLQAIDPASPGVLAPGIHFPGENVWKVSLMVARAGTGKGSYSWPSKTILNRMFSPIDPSERADRAGLGLSPADVMLNPTSVYAPPGDIGCGWTP